MTNTTNTERLVEALKLAADTLGEAGTYTGSVSWSPSMTAEVWRAESVCRAALAEAEGHALPQGWKRMKTAPKDGTTVLVLTEGSDVPKAVRWREADHFLATGGVGWYMTWDGTKIQPHDGPRYWMHCPDDPDEPPGAAAPEAPAAPVDPWKDAIDHALASMEATTDNYATPRDAVNALIDWHCSVVLDPAVSSDAQALIDRGRSEAAPAVAEPVVWQMTDKHGDTVYVGVTYTRSADLVLDCDLRYPDNAPHEQIPLYARPPAPRDPLTADEVRARFDLPFISDEKAERISEVLVGLCIATDREGG